MIVLCFHNNSLTAVPMGAMSQMTKIQIDVLLLSLFEFHYF